MRLEVLPSVSAEELAALQRALGQAGTTLEASSERPVTPWSRMTALEAVDVPVAAERYARSPRSTPGATRA